MTPMVTCEEARGGSECSRLHDHSTPCKALQGLSLQPLFLKTQVFCLSISVSVLKPECLRARELREGIPVAHTSLWKLLKSSLGVVLSARPEVGSALSCR